MSYKLLFAGDGPRDEGAVPQLVATLVGLEVVPEFNAWKDIRLQSGGKGLGGYGASSYICCGERAQIISRG